MPSSLFRKVIACSKLSGKNPPNYGIGLSPELFAKFQALIYSDAGIWLTPHKALLLSARLTKRLRQLDIDCMTKYFQLVSKANQRHERMLMIDCITTNETRFFREPRHFEFLAQVVFPQWKKEWLSGHRAPRIRVWSAGCSTGEEPYSIAMMLLKYFGDSGWDLQVLATDISTGVLEKAKKGIFPLKRSAEIPPDYLRGYMLKGVGEHDDCIKVSRDLQRLVRFSHVNLYADADSDTESYDLIFCRNVMIYFDQQSKKKVVSRLENHLSPFGYLLIGHSENLHGLSLKLRAIIPTVYRMPIPDQEGSTGGVPLHQRERR